MFTRDGAYRRTIASEPALSSYRRAPRAPGEPPGAASGFHTRSPQVAAARQTPGAWRLAPDGPNGLTDAHGPETRRTDVTKYSVSPKHDVGTPRCCS
jgi:hypothetical protein